MPFATEARVEAVREIPAATETRVESVRETRVASETPIESVPPAAPRPVTRPVALELPPIAPTLPPDSGLILVETSHPAPTTTTEAEAPRPKRVRPPRVEIVSEPLEIVETRKEN